MNCATGVNKIGMMKDEAAGQQIEEFVGLRVKLFFYEMFRGDKHKKCKVVKCKVVKKMLWKGIKLTHHDHQACWLKRETVHRTIIVFRS